MPKMIPWKGDEPVRLWHRHFIVKEKFLLIEDDGEEWYVVSDGEKTLKLHRVKDSKARIDDRQNVIKATKAEVESRQNFLKSIASSPLRSDKAWDKLSTDQKLDALRKDRLRSDFHGNGL